MIVKYGRCLDCGGTTPTEQIQGPKVQVMFVCFLFICHFSAVALADLFTNDSVTPNFINDVLVKLPIGRSQCLNSYNR